MGLVTAERSSLTNESQQRGGVERTATGSQRKGRSATFLRQDLPPIETSQVACVRRRHVTVGDQQVFPTVVIQISEQRTPCPTSKLHSCLPTSLGKSTVTLVFKEIISHSLITKSIGYSQIKVTVIIKIGK